MLLSAHVCHPSLANDNCSGLALLTHLAKQLGGHEDALQLPLRVRARHRSARSPGWRATKTRSGASSMASSCHASATVAGPTYKRSRRGNAEIDRAMAHVLRHWGTSPRSSTSHPMVTTSGNTVLLASTFRSGCSSAASSALSPSTTRRPTTWSSLARASCLILPDDCRTDRRARGQPDFPSTRHRRVSRNSASAASTARSAATRMRRQQPRHAVGA